LQKKLIISDPAIKLGRPVVAGTRVAVDELLDRLAAGATVAELVAAHPGLSAAAVLEALRFAADAVRRDSPLAAKSPLELNGPQPLALPAEDREAARPALAVRAYLPDAASVSLRRLPPPPSGRAWIPALDPAAGPGADAAALPTLHPMERVHPEGVFEAVFPGETEPFAYQLAVRSGDGETRVTDSAHGLPPALAAADLAAWPEASAPVAAGAPAPGRWHDLFGAHVTEHAGRRGVNFAVWAPNAAGVSLIGDFNSWDPRYHPLRPVGESGVWELFVPGLEAGAVYKYRIAPRGGGPAADKADPYAFAAEVRPRTASIVWDLAGYRWGDAAWLAGRAERQALGAPLAVYEVHLGSWRRPGGAAGAPERRWLNYRELADQLVPYVRDMGYTHIEPMPVAEHPLDGSWGYQVTGFFAATARYGTPDDFRYFVDRAHQHGLGVILDWVPGHFPKDAHGLARFDGTALYEHPDPRRSENVEWGTLAFNHERPEVRAFLLSNAIFWLEEFHLDGLRVDAVSSMIYLDYSRQHWVPNALGGRENLAAARFLQQLNAHVHRHHPGVLMIAEESTAWPRVTGREVADSLGFDLKWNLGWMHDTLGYAEKDPIYRRHHHQDLTFSLVYAFKENFLLPFSHDEVVHGKRSMLSKMPGDDWQRFANLRALYGYMYAHPGKKLHFMGSEFGARKEWDENAELEWGLLEHAPHRQLQAYVRELNRLYRAHPALHEVDFSWEGFEWIDCEDAERSLVSFVRRSRTAAEFIVAAANFTPVPRAGYRLGVPMAGAYAELLNSDGAAYGGSGLGNPATLEAEAVPLAGQPYSLLVTLPPLALVLFALAPAAAPARRRARRPAPARP
jgi:1,4-alpha-glucan branching enzyme